MTATIFAGLVAVLGLALKYYFEYIKLDGPARRRSAAFLASLRVAAASRTKRVGLLLFKLFTVALCAWIVIESVLAILRFLAADSPIRRGEVFGLILNVFNTLMYMIATLIMIGLVLPKAKKREPTGLVMTRREGETILLSADPGADAHEIYQALTGPGVAITIEKIQGSRVKLAVKAPTSISVGRDGPVKA